MDIGLDRPRVARLGRALLVVVMVLATVAASATPAAAFVRGSPDFGVTLSDDTVEPGDDTTLQLSLSNSGEVKIGAESQLLAGKENTVTTARGTVVRVDGGGSAIDVETDTVALGSVPEGSRSVPIDVAVAEDASPGTYELDIEVEYDYTKQINGDPFNRYENRHVTDEFTVEVTVEEAAQFEVVRARTDAPVGGSGTVDLTLENVGSRNASAAALSLRSVNGELTFGGTPTAETFVGEFEPGERRTFAFGADVAPSATDRSLSLEATLSYEDGDGVARQSTLTTGVTPRTTSRVQAVAAETTAAVDDAGRLEVRLRNTGDRTLREAAIAFDSGNAALTFGGSPTAETAVGRWEPGEVKTVVVENSFGPAAENRTYVVDATVTYTGQDGRTASSKVVSLPIQPAAEQTFSVRTVDSTAAVGGNGQLTVALTNTGDRRLRDASVTLQSDNGALTFGGAPSARTFVGSWEPGQTRQFGVETGFAPSAEERSYAVDATVSYTDPDGRAERADPVTVGVQPAPEQAFDLEGHETALRVGQEGRLTGTVVNEGPGAVENAVLVLEPPANVVTAEREFAVGDLGSGDTVEFRYDVEVSAEARQGPRQFTYRLRYEDDGGDTVTTDPIYARGTVAQQRDVFGVETDASLAAGSSGVVEVQVTNNGDEPVSGVTAKLFADDPISASNDEAFAEELAPGETTTLKFQLGAAGGAIAKPYPVSLDFQYTEPDGDTKISDSYQVAVDVTGGGGGGFLSVMPAGLTGTGLGLGVVLSLGGLAAVGLGLIGRPE
jgi:hypothetical protein